MTTTAIKSLRPRIEPTPELLTSLKTAQLKCAQEHIESALADGYGDDGYDYLKGALSLARDLVVMDYDGDMESLDKLLNGDDQSSELMFIACDGIASNFYDLDCNAIACLYGD
jgi:hypothetical protein